MRPYRTFTKTYRGAVAYERLRNGKIVAHITNCGCGTGGQAGRFYGHSFVRGKAGQTIAEARDNLDARLVQMARLIRSKNDRQLRKYLSSIGFVVSSCSLRHRDRTGLSIAVEGNGLEKARFYAARILKAHELLQAKRKPAMKKAA